MPKRDVDKMLGEAEHKEEAPKIRIGFSGGMGVESRAPGSPGTSPKGHISSHLKLK